MAWAEKYKAEFNDHLGLLWTTKIYEDGFSGSVTELVCTGQPLIFEWSGRSDDIYDPVIESTAIIKVFASTNFALADLYATEDRHFKVEIYSAETPVLRFVGYIDCGNYEEPYEDVPYEVTITASCGLKFLKEILYDDDGTPYNGRLLESGIILEILAKVGFTSFYEYINLYEESMADDVDDSPMDQLRVDVDTFRGMYCYDVLVELLKKYGAIIRQISGYYRIYRPVELKSATVYGRYFTGETTKVGVSYAPQQYIDRSTNASYLLQVPGGIKMIIPPAKKVTIHQDYGNKESWIDNYELRGDSYDPVSGEFDNWTPGAGWSKFTVPGEIDGIVMQNTGTAVPASTINVSQSFGAYIVTATDVLIFSFEYLTANYTGSIISSVTAYIMIKSDNASKYLEIDDDENYQWSDTEAMIEIGLNVPVGKSSWATFSRVITSIPTAGSYTITLWGIHTASACYTIYKNLKFYATNDYIGSQKVKKYYYPTEGADFIQKAVNFVFRKKKWIEEKTYNDLPEIVQHDWVKENSINGTDLEYEIILGDVTKSGDGKVDIDNIVEQFSGALICNERTLLQVVHTVTLTADTPDGTANITCDELTKLATYTTDLPETAAAFVTDHNSAYAAQGITVTNSGADLIFTGTAGQDFDGDTTIVNVSGGLDGSVGETQPDHYSDALSFTTDWNTRGGSESKELLSILVDEIAVQFARPKQLIQMSLRDTLATAPTIMVYLMSCYEDDLNQFDGSNRKFILGRGSFDVKERYIEVDFKEVI